MRGQTRESKKKKHPLSQTTPQPQAHPHRAPLPRHHTGALLHLKQTPSLSKPRHNPKRTRTAPHSRATAPAPCSST